MALLRCGAGSANIIEFVASSETTSITINNALDYANFVVCAGSTRGHDTPVDIFTMSATGGTIGTINEDVSDQYKQKYCQSAIVTPTDNTLAITTNLVTNDLPLIVVYGVRK